MGKKTIGLMISAMLLLFASAAVCTGIAAPAGSSYHSPGQIAITKEKPAQLSAAERLYFDNALDVFSLRYDPADQSLNPATLCTVYTFTHEKWKAVTEAETYTAAYTVFKESENFVFVIHKTAQNPYEANSGDYRGFAFNAGQSEQFILNEFKFGEVKASNAAIMGATLNYYIQLPVMKNITAIRNVAVQGELQKETIDFISTATPAQRITTLYVYEKPAWQSLNETKQKAIGTVALDFMNYVFVLTPMTSHPYIDHSPDATGFIQAYQAIGQAAATAYVYNPEGVQSAVRFSGGAVTLYANGHRVSNQILFDRQNRPLLPIRALAEGLDYQIAWDTETSSFIILKGDSLVAARSVDAGYTLDNYKDAGQINCALINGSVYVDLEFAVSVLNCAVSLNDSLQAISVRTR